MKRLIIIAAVITAMGVASAQATEIVKVMGRGVGADKVEALKDAYRDAVERAVGLYVDAEQMMKNEELVKDQILTHSNAYIDKYEIMGETVAPNGLVTVKILAEVKTRTLTKKVSETMPSSTTSINTARLQGFHAKITTQEKRTVDGAALVENVLKDLDPVKQLVKVSLALPEPKIEQSKSNPDVAKLYFLLKFEIDHDRYRNEYMPKLRDVLRQVSVETPRMIMLERKRPADNANLGNDVYRDSRLFEHPVGYYGLLDGYLSNDIMKFSVTLNGVNRDLMCYSFCLSKRLFLTTDFSDSFSRCQTEVFQLEEKVAKILSKWVESFISDDKSRYRFHNLALKDTNGVIICIKTEETYIGKVMPIHVSSNGWSLIMPVFRCSRHYDYVSSAYYKWVACEIDKDDLPKIASVTIEAAE